ncbi:hypothetical protein BGZ81_004806 [Podila clonocystis]|nr:hypothetical protein BGZ81_004806 [Podila clonocystis]
MDTDLSPVSAPSGSESNDNDAFDGDEMMLLPPPCTSLAPSSGTVSVPDNPDANTLVSPSKPRLPPMDGDTVEMDRRSRRKRTIQRLQAKNRSLKLSLTQAKADLAAERQQRALIDQIYLKIKQDLNQKLETEETKNANLKADLEQITQDMKELKDRTSPSGIGSYFSPSLSSRSSLGGVGSGSSGYKIGYDSSAYCASLSGGISSMSGMLHSSNMVLINGQDDSEEFLNSHAYSPSTTRCRSMSLSTSSMLQTVKESESEDENMFSEDEGHVVNLSNSRSQSSLPTLMETGGEEESEDDDYDESSDDEAEYSEDEVDNGDAPRTMMEILLQRQSSHSPDDDVQDQPADANETYESMAQKCLRHAVRSRFTAAQTHLQLDELIIKYDPRPEQTMAAISHELVRWWETERISTGGPAAIGGIFGNGPVVMKETGEQVVPKVAVETRFQRFFAPLLLHYVASHTEQKTLLDILGHEVQAQGQQDAKLLRNHNGQLMALYKFDVVEAEAIVEWWQGLALPTNAFGPGDNLRSLNSRFVAWLEDEDDDSDDEEDTEDDSDYMDDDSDSEEDTDVASSEEDEVDEVTFNAQLQREALDLQKDMALVDRTELGLMDKGCEQIVPEGALAQSSQAEDENAPDPQQYLQDRKRRISFCASSVYYNQNGRMRTGPAYFPGGDDVTEVGNGFANVSGGPNATNRPRKTYQQCPPFVPQLSDEDDEVEEESDESIEGSGSSDGPKLVA